MKEIKLYSMAFIFCVLMTIIAMACVELYEMFGSIAYYLFAISTILLVFLIDVSTKYFPDI